MSSLYISCSLEPAIRCDLDIIYGVEDIFCDLLASFWQTSKKVLRPTQGSQTQGRQTEGRQTEGRQTEGRQTEGRQMQGRINRGKITNRG